MQLSRRGLAVAGCGLALAVAAPVLARPVLLAAAAAIGAVLLGVGVAFVRRAGAERDALAISIETDSRETLVDRTTTVTLDVERPAATLPLLVSVALPGAASASAASLTVQLDAHESASYALPVSWPVAGTYRVGPPRIVATDPLGLFVAAFELDVEQQVRVQPRPPGIAHLGRGGEQIATAFGEHRASHAGAGIEASALKRYEPGAQVSRIDWKATARLDEVYVVDPEAETDRQTVLLVDHRATTAVGAGSETAMAYLRNAALAIVGSARDLGDPVGCFAVGDRGVTVAEQPSVGPGQYAIVEDAVHSLQPTHASDPVGGANSARGTGTGVQADGAGATPEPAELGPTSTDAQFAARAARRLGDAPRLGDDDARRLDDDAEADAFARTLGPFFDDEAQYLHRVEDEPLFAAARTFLKRLRGSLWTVVVTDDSRRGELRETVKVARRSDDRVLVVLAPRALYEADSTADVDQTYDRYREFESFRRELASMDRVEVIEVAPGERVDAVLAAGGEAA